MGIQVHLLNLSGIETEQDLGLAGRVGLKDLIYLRKLWQQCRIGINALLEQKVVVSLLKIRKGEILLRHFTAW